MRDLRVAPSHGDSLGFHSYGESVGRNDADNPPGCPSLGFIFGSFGMGDDMNINATALLCSQTAEQVQTETQFLLPSWDLDPSRPAACPRREDHQVSSQSDQCASLPYPTRLRQPAISTKRYQGVLFRQSNPAGPFLPSTPLRPRKTPSTPTPSSGPLTQTV